MRLKRRTLSGVAGISGVEYLVLAADQLKRAGGVEADCAQPFIHMLADRFAIAKHVAGSHGIEVLKTSLSHDEAAACRIVEFALLTSLEAVPDDTTRDRIWSEALTDLLLYREYSAVIRQTDSCPEDQGPGREPSCDG